MSASLSSPLWYAIVTAMNQADVQRIKEWLGSGSINLFGRPFAGKDTQGRTLAELFGGVLLGGGDILRGSDMPDHIKALMKTGTLIPTDDYISIVLPHLMHASLEGKPLILSSVGRWHGEEQGVLQAAEQAGHPVKAVIYLSLDEATVRRRWERFAGTHARGIRHDDTAEVLEIRLKEYREKTLPVIEFYRNQGLLIEIDGTHSPEAVHQEVLQALLSRASTSP